MKQIQTQPVDAILALIAAEPDTDARRELFIQATDAINIPRPADGLALARAVYPMMESTGDVPGMAYALYGEGACLNTMNDHAGASNVLDRAHALFSQIGEKHGIMRTLRQIANAYLGMARFAESAEISERGLEIAREIGDRREEAFLLRNLGACGFNRGEYPAALRYFFDCLAIFRELGDRKWEGRITSSIGTVYSGLNDSETTLEYLLRALELLREYPPDNELALLLTNLGLVYQHFEQTDRAIPLVKEGLEIFRMTGNSYLEANSHGILGFLYSHLNDFAAAAPHLDEAVRLTEEIDSSNDLIETLRTAGLAYMKFGEYPKALEYFLRSLKQAEESGTRKIMQTLHRNIATVYKHLGEFSQALEHFEIAEQLREEMMELETRAIVDEMQAKFDVAQAEKERELAVLKAEHLEHQVNHRVRELAALELNLKGREELLNLLQLRIESGLMKKRDDPAMVLRNMLHEIEKEKQTPQNYNAYFSRLDQFQENVYRTLTERFPKLTPAELKICSLMRGNMSTKEIADLLCVTTRNVETHRYHIRQKMKLPKEVNLTTFLATL